jgi:hypothetical protein
LAKQLSASMYLHPWDVIDEKADTVLQRIKDGGMEAVNLATSYHTGRYILPHNPKRKIFSAEEGVVYFKPQMELYKNTVLKPRPSTTYLGKDVLMEVVQRSSQYDLAVNSWTVVFHNSVFAAAHPDLAVRNVFGDSDANRLCPSSDGARNYLFALVKDLATNYQLGSIMLESIGFPAGASHGNHHETFGTPIEPVVSELLATCFCDACVANAKKQGIDLTSYRKKVAQIIELSTGMPQHVLERVPIEQQLKNLHVLSHEMDEIKELVTFKATIVSELLRETKNALKDTSSKCSLTTAAYAILAGEPNLGRGSEGIFISAIKSEVDAINFVAYTGEPAEAYYLVKWAKYEAGDCPILVVLRPGYPVLTSREAVLNEIKAVAEAGADGFQFYNYGWTPLVNFAWVREGLDAVRKQTRLR